MKEIAHWEEPEIVLDNTRELLQATVRQIKKDFLQNGLELQLAEEQFENYHGLLKSLEEMLAWLLERDEQRLLQLLYRIDLGEEKLKKSMMENEHNSLATLLAQLIIKREAQKVLIRNHFRHNNQ